VVLTSCCWEQWTVVEHGPRCTAGSVRVAAVRQWVNAGGVAGGDVVQQRLRSKAGSSGAVCLCCHLVYVEWNGRMISKDRTARDCLSSFEALPGQMMGGSAEKHEILQFTQAVCGPKFETRSLRNTSCSFCLPESNVWVEPGNKLVAVTSLAAASDKASW
jgi:hypothetical protein